MNWTPEAAQRRVDQFFAKCRVVWGNGAFNHQFGNELDLKLAKQEYFNEILQPSDDELRMAFEHAKRMIAAGDPDWRYPHPERILAGAKRYMTAAHRFFLPPPTPTAEQIEQQKAAAASAMAEIRNILGEGRP